MAIEQAGASGSGVSRRNFLKGIGLASAAVAGASLAGCAPSSGGSDAGKAGGSVPEVTQRLLDRGILGANLPDAAPILPVNPPETWDAEADVVVVGLGGGGLVATGYLAEQGLKVIGIEKQATVGGASRHAANFVNGLGGAKSQLETGFPGIFGGDVDAAVAHAHQLSAFSGDEKFWRTLVTESAEACDWIYDQNGMNLVCCGMAWHDADVSAGRQNHVLGMNSTMDALEGVARANGADIWLSSAVQKFVSDGTRVVGVVVSDSNGEDQYVKAKKGLLLSAGGFGMNKDLIKAYLPSCYPGAVQGGPMPYHTGEIFRMGLGVGADFSGYDTWSCWEGAVDESIAGGDGEFWHYFWRGERQLFHNPWLVIDHQGNRQPYFANTQEGYVDPAGGLGDLTTTMAWMQTMQHHVYSICDSKFPEEVFKKNTCDYSTPLHDSCRQPVNDASKLLDTGGLVSADWVAEVEEAVERGAVKKANTLDELAEMLNLDPEKVKNAVENYNRICDQGFDDEMAIPYDPSWLSPIDTPPYYAAIVGGQIGKTLCGLRVNGDLQVTDEYGEVIPGLYAGFSTLGGMHGTGNNGAFWNGGMFFGGVGSSLITGYIAAKKLLGLEE